MHQHIPGLTGLRGLAALSVLAYHFQLGDFGSYGCFGVDLFFILSGYILTHVYQGEWSIRSFFRSRIARTLPTHLAATSIVGLTLMAWSQASWADIVRGLCGISLINPPTWSLFIEWYAYVLFVLAAILPRWIFPRNGIALFICSVLAAYGILHSTPNAFDLALIVRSLSEFALGATLSRTGWQPQGRFWQILDMPLIRWFGDISYPLYLIQWAIRFAVSDGLSHAPTTGETIIGISGAIMMAAALHYGIEDPARRWLRSKPDSNNLVENASKKEIYNDPSLSTMPLLRR